MLQMNHKRKLQAAGLALLVFTLLAACNGGDDTGPTPPGPPATYDPELTEVVPPTKTVEPVTTPSGQAPLVPVVDTSSTSTFGSGSLLFTAWNGHHQNLYKLTPGSSDIPNILPLSIAENFMGLYGTVSPNGHFLAIHYKESGSKWKIAIFIVAEEGYLELATDQAPANVSESRPNWSSNSTEIIYHREEGSKWTIWTLDVLTGAKEQLIVSALGNLGQPTWSPDGEKIAYESYVDSTNGFDIYEYTVSTGEIVPLITGPGHQRSPTYSPDGHLMAYSKEDFLHGDGDTNPYDIWVYDLFANEHISLTDLVGSEGRPYWATNTEILFDYEGPDDRKSIWYVNLDLARFEVDIPEYLVDPQGISKIPLTGAVEVP